MAGPYTPGIITIITLVHPISHILEVELLLQKIAWDREYNRVPLHSFIYSFIQKADIEYPLWVRHGNRHLGYKGQQY